MNQLLQLIRAIESADSAAASAIMDANPMLVNQPVAANTAHGHGTLLHLAMPGDGRDLVAGHVQIVSLLLQHGAKVDALGYGPNHGSCTPLSLAAWGGHVPLVDLLLEHGADPNGNPALQPLRTAARHGHKDVVEVLIRAGADYDFLDLLVAGLTERVIAHLDSHPDAINVPLRNGSPPLHAALDREMQGGAALVSLLLEREADPSLRDARGRTALHVAIEVDNRDAISILRASADSLDLFAAAGLAEHKAVLNLLRADPRHADEKQVDGVTPLFYAAHSGSSEIARALLDAGAHPSPRSDRFWACLSPLHLAIQRNNLDVARILLERGADVDACGSDTDRYKPTPLHVAARWRGIDVVRLLLDCGATLHGSADSKGAVNNDVLNWVLFADQAAILQLLFERGLDSRDVNACFALHQAAAYGHADLVRLLIEQGADKSARDRNGQTPRDVALAHGKTHLDILLT